MNAVVRFQADDLDVTNGWLTLGSDDHRCHVNLGEVSSWRYAVGDGVLTIVGTGITFVVTGPADDYATTNELDRALWAALVEGGVT